MRYDSLGFPHVQEVVKLVAKFQHLPDPGGQEVPEFFWVIPGGGRTHQTGLDVPVSLYLGDG